MSKDVKENNDLNPKQIEVLTELLAGATQREAANVAEINEATVSRWMHNDAAFIAAYNDGLQSLYDASAAMLLEMRREAIYALSKMLEVGDWKKRIAAVSLILKHSPRPAGPATAEDVETAADLKRHKTARQKAGLEPI